ncbi:MAG TPA: hypothetical protein PLQ56_13630 [Aggregatilineales bacterium]|nr:hypothetical protein [Anaerolineae bacterium]HUN07643.1 hypothetical protein [Aggregatilineales bacterium]
MSLQAEIAKATIENVRSSLVRHMPLSPQRNYYLWGISNANPYREDFIQMIGVNQLINLSTQMIGDIIEPADQATIAQYCGRINAYFMYEIISDNLANGLSALCVFDDNASMRRDVLHAFNHVMVTRLKGEHNDTASLLQPVENLTKNISCFAQSITPRKHQACINAYLSQRPDVTQQEIEYGVWPFLVANIEACHELTEYMSHFQVGPLLSQGGIDRYQGVTRTIQLDHGLPLNELVRMGTHTVSVVPVLAYFAGVLSEIIRVEPRLHSVINDGTLADALNTAAVIVRLVNDVGMLLTLSQQERKTVFTGIQQHFQTHSGDIDAFDHLLMSVPDEYTMLTRLQKDLLHGEFNICLHNLAYTNSVGEALTLLENNVANLSEQYYRSQTHLHDLLASIDRRMTSRTLSNLIAGFVRFHEMIYAEPYNSSIGEYVA